MKINNKHIVLFDKYLDGELSSKWIKAFEEKIATDNSLKEAFEEHKLVRYAIKMEGKSILKKELIGLTPELPQAKKYKPNFGTGGGVIKWLSILGVIINLGLLSWYYILPCLNMEITAGITRDCVFESHSETENSLDINESETKIDTKKVKQVEEKKGNNDEVEDGLFEENNEINSESINSSVNNNSELIVDTNIIYLFDTVLVDKEGIPVDIEISTPNDTAIFQRILEKDNIEVKGIKYRYDTLLVQPGEKIVLPEDAIIIDAE